MMAKHTKLSICRFRSRERQRRRGSDGIVLIIVMVVATLLLIALTAALPSVYQEGQREREEELIFRGTQYARAVALFHRQFNRYPVSVKELLGTNGIRFLRKEYRRSHGPQGKVAIYSCQRVGSVAGFRKSALGYQSKQPRRHWWD